jgi:hypothetical protein
LAKASSWPNGILEQRERARVAGGVVDEHLEARVDPKDVQLVGEASLQFQPRHRIGQRQRRVLAQLALAERVHREHAERRRAARQTDGEMLGLKVRHGGVERSQRSQQQGCQGGYWLELHDGIASAEFSFRLHCGGR